MDMVFLIYLFSGKTIAFLYMTFRTAHINALNYIKLIFSYKNTTKSF